MQGFIVGLLHGEIVFNEPLHTPLICKIFGRFFSLIRLSISEIALVSKPVILVPSPNVAADHQTKNAKAIVDKNGAILLKENELDEKFQTVFSELVSNENLQNELSRNIKNLAKPNATKDIVEEILKLV